MPFPITFNFSVRRNRSTESSGIQYYLLCKVVTHRKPTAQILYTISKQILRVSTAQDFEIKLTLQINDAASLSMLIA